MSTPARPRSAQAKASSKGPAKSSSKAPAKAPSKGPSKAPVRVSAPPAQVHPKWLAAAGLSVVAPILLALALDSWTSQPPVPAPRPAGSQNVEVAPKVVPTVDPVPAPAPSSSAFETEEPVNVEVPEPAASASAAPHASARAPFPKASAGAPTTQTAGDELMPPPPRPLGVDMSLPKSKAPGPR